MYFPIPRRALSTGLPLASATWPDDDPGELIDDEHDLYCPGVRFVQWVEPRDADAGSPRREYPVAPGHRQSGLAGGVGASNDRTSDRRAAGRQPEFRIRQGLIPGVDDVADDFGGR